MRHMPGRICGEVRLLETFGCGHAITDCLVDMVATEERKIAARKVAAKEEAHHEKAGSKHEKAGSKE